MQSEVLDQVAVVQVPTAFVFDAAGATHRVNTQLRHGDAVELVSGAETVAGAAWQRVRGGALGVDEGWMQASALVGVDEAFGGDAGRSASPAKPQASAETGSGSEARADARGALPGGAVVSSLVAQVFASASRKAGPCFEELPGEARVIVLEQIEGDAASPLDHNAWCRVRLADGREGWVQGGDLARPALPVLRHGAARVAEAERLLGRPYVWGGQSTFGLDCSGLTAILARRSEVDGKRVVLPHSAKRQFLEDWPGLVKVGEDRTIAELSDAQRGEESQPGSKGWRDAEVAAERWGALMRPGDFVYFAMSAANDNARIDHVGVYAGTPGQPSDGTLIHASSGGLPCTRREPMWGVGLPADRRSTLAMRMLGVRRVG